MASAAAATAAAGPPNPDIPCSENVTRESIRPTIGSPSEATLKGSYLGLPATYFVVVDAALAATDGGGAPAPLGGTSTYSVNLTVPTVEMNKLAVTGVVTSPPQFRIDWVKKRTGAQAGLLLKVKFTRI